MNNAREAARGDSNGDGPPRVNRLEAGECNDGGGVRDRWPDGEDPLLTSSASGGNAVGGNDGGTVGCGGWWRRDRRWSSVMWAAVARVCMVAARVCIKR